MQFRIDHIDPTTDLSFDLWLASAPTEDELRDAVQCEAGVLECLAVHRCLSLVEPICRSRVTPQRSVVLTC